MKKLLIIFFSLSCFMLFINKVNALDLTDVFLIMADDCEYVLGDLNDSDSFAYLLQEIFDVIKFATPILVIVLSVIDYTKAITSSDKDVLVKTNKRTIIRIILGLCLFLTPTLLNFVFELVGWTGTCGIG